MNPSDEDHMRLDESHLFQSVVRVVGFVLVGFVLFFVLLFFSLFYLLEVIYALAAGWAYHAVRIAPDLWSHWPWWVVSVLVLVAAWWVAAHRSVGSARARAVMGFVLLLLMGAATWLVGGIVQQVVWLSQTQWTQSSRRTETFQAINDMRMLNLAAFEFDWAEGRLPHDFNELIEWYDGINDGSLRNTLHSGPRREMLLPMFVKPGSRLRGAPPNEIVMLSNRIEGGYVVALADGGVTGITPEKLEEILHRGDWRLLRD